MGGALRDEPKRSPDASCLDATSNPFRFTIRHASSCDDNCEATAHRFSVRLVATVRHSVKRIGTKALITVPAQLESEGVKSAFSTPANSATSLTRSVCKLSHRSSLRGLRGDKRRKLGNFKDFPLVRSAGGTPFLAALYRIGSTRVKGSRSRRFAWCWKTPASSFRSHWRGRSDADGPLASRANSRITLSVFTQLGK